MGFNDQGDLVYSYTYYDPIQDRVIDPGRMATKKYIDDRPPLQARGKGIRVTAEELDGEGRFIGGQRVGFQTVVK